MVYADSGGPDQPVHLQSLIRIFTGRILIAKNEDVLFFVVFFFHLDNEDSDQKASYLALRLTFSLLIYSNKCPGVKYTLANVSKCF